MFNQNNKFQEEIRNMLRMSSFGQKPNLTNESKIAKKLIKEDFVDDISDIFDNPDNAQEETKFSTAGPKIPLSMEMKAAMLAPSMKVYFAKLLKIYKEFDYDPQYKTHTAGATADFQHVAKTKKNDPTGKTFYSKPSIEKVKGISQDYNRIGKFDPKSQDDPNIVDPENKSVPTTFTTPEDTLRNLPPDQKALAQRWWNKKSLDLISYNHGTHQLTDLGKSQLEFLARVYANKPADKMEKVLFNIYLDEGNHFSEVAEDLLRQFYELALVPYIMEMTHRAKYNHYDFQLKHFIETGLNHALNQIKDGKFDPTRGNIGTFIITVVKNNVKNQLARIAPYVLNKNLAAEYLYSIHFPFTAYSVADPQDIGSKNYSNVTKIKDRFTDELGNSHRALFAYTYQTPEAVWEDLNNDARNRTGVSPLSARFLIKKTKDKFYQSLPPSNEDIKNGLNMQNIDPEKEYNIFNPAAMPKEAKAQTMNVLSDIYNRWIISDARNQKYIKFMTENPTYTQHLMFELLNRGAFIEVYTHTWEINNNKKGVTKMNPGDPVVYVDDDISKKKMPDVSGKLPGDNDVKWVWKGNEQGERQIIQYLADQYYKEFVREGKKYNIVYTKALNQQTEKEQFSLFLTRLYSSIREFFGIYSKTERKFRNGEMLDVLLNNISSAKYHDMEAASLNEQFEEIKQEIIFELKNKNR